jgi:antitoxin FitA
MITVHQSPTGSLSLGSCCTLSHSDACILPACRSVSVAITIRDVPDVVRDELAARAARAGKSLQEYLRGMLVETATHPTVDDVIARARARVAATGVRVDADSILAARDAERR